MAIQATPSRRNSHQHGLSAWTAGRSGLRKVSIKSIISYDLTAPKQKVWKVTGCAQRTKMVHDGHLEFSQCRVRKLLIDPQSRAKLQMMCWFFQMFFRLFSGCSIGSVLRGKRFLGFGVHQVPLDLGGGLQSCSRRGMGCALRWFQWCRGRWGSLGGEWWWWSLMDYFGSLYTICGGSRVTWVTCLVTAQWRRWWISRENRLEVGWIFTNFYTTS